MFIVDHVFSSLKYQQGAARRVRCASKVFQLGYHASFYADDYDDFYFPATCTVDGNTNQYWCGFSIHPFAP